MKMIVWCFFILALITSCKYVRKNPSKVISSSALVNCTNEVNLDGVDLAQKQSVSGSQCVIAQCEEGYAKFNVEKLVDDIIQFCQSFPGYCEENYESQYLPAELVALAEQYPMVCVPAAQPCEGEGFSNGERPFVGFSVPSEPEIESIGFSPIVVEDEEEDQLAVLEDGYAYCQPVNEDSCMEGWNYSEYPAEYNGVSYTAKTCTPNQQNLD